MKKRILALMGAVLMLLFMVSCGGSGDTTETPETSEPSETAETPTGPVEATEGATITTDSGTFTFHLSKAYVGDDAISELSNIGEDPSNFTFNDDPAYKAVLFEYEVKVDSGEFHGEEMSGQFYESDQTAKMDDFMSYTFYKNADKDIFGGDIQMSDGDTATVYAAYGFPADLTEFYDELPTGEWIHYTL